MKGYLVAKGYNLSEKRISKSFQRVAPGDYEHRRQNTLDRTNPILYQSWYFGHKLHIDQNEKLAQYGVTHVLARDGYSGMIVSHLTLPVKNNLAIYDVVYR